MRTKTSDLSFDPLTQDLWIMGIMSLQFHLFLAGNDKSVCGYRWHTDVWEMTDRKPQDRLCLECDLFAVAMEDKA